MKHPIKRREINVQRLTSVSLSFIVRITTKADGKKNYYIFVFIKQFLIETVTYATVKFEMYIWTIVHHEFLMKEHPHMFHGKPSRYRSFTFQKYFGKFSNLVKIIF